MIPDQYMLTSSCKYLDELFFFTLVCQYRDVIYNWQRKVFNIDPT